MNKTTINVELRLKNSEMNALKHGKVALVLWRQDSNGVTKHKVAFSKLPRETEVVDITDTRCDITVSYDRLSPSKIRIRK